MNQELKETVKLTLWSFLVGFLLSVMISMTTSFFVDNDNCTPSIVPLNDTTSGPQAFSVNTCGKRIILVRPDDILAPVISDPVNNDPKGISLSGPAPKPEIQGVPKPASNVVKSQKKSTNSIKIPQKNFVTFD